jgi:hypothetical protein
LGSSKSSPISGNGSFVRTFQHTATTQDAGSYCLFYERFLSENVILQILYRYPEQGFERSLRGAKDLFKLMSALSNTLPPLRKPVL